MIKIEVEKPEIVAMLTDAMDSRQLVRIGKGGDPCRVMGMTTKDGQVYTVDLMNVRPSDFEFFDVDGN